MTTYQLRPSASDIWLNCAASLPRTAHMPNESSQYAEEGTAAHELAGFVLSTGCPTVAEMQWKGELSRKWDSPDMRMYVQQYVDFVRSHVKDGELFVEQHLKIYEPAGIAGTADCLIVHPEGIIEIIDLKYGAGVLVEAEGNTQLILYALGGLKYDIFCEVPVHTVRISVVQPRRDGFKTVEYSVEFLTKWVKENEARIAAAYIGKYDAAVPGSHCKWCQAKASCKERAEQNLELARFDFAPNGTVCQTDEVLTLEQQVAIFNSLADIRAFLSDIEQAVTIYANEHGAPSGTKFVEGRSTRIIIDQALAAKQLEAVGVKPWREPDLLGITELTKQLKAKKLKLEEVLDGNIEKRIGAKRLVSAASDEMSSAMQDFA